MEDLPIDGGIMLKLGERSAKVRARAVHFEKDAKTGTSSLVYKTQRLLSKDVDARLELGRNFFVRHVRPALEHETALVTAFAKENTVFADLEAKRCFDIDFFEPDFRPAIGPTKLRTVTLFATPDSAISDLWSYMSNIMMEQGVFAPSPEDPDLFVVVNVGERRKSTTTSPVSSSVIIPIPSPPPKNPKLSMIDAEILLNSLPLPPATELVDVSNEDVD